MLAGRLAHLAVGRAGGVPYGRSFYGRPRTTGGYGGRPGRRAGSDSGGSGHGRLLDRIVGRDGEQYEEQRQHLDPFAGQDAVVGEVGERQDEERRIEQGEHQIGVAPERSRQPA